MGKIYEGYKGIFLYDLPNFSVKKNKIYFEGEKEK